MCDWRGDLRDVKRLNSAVEGTLRISSSASRSTGLIQQYLHAFHKISFRALRNYEGLMSDVTESLLNGRTEIGLCNSQMVDTSRFRYSFYPAGVTLCRISEWRILEQSGKRQPHVGGNRPLPPSAYPGGSVRMLMQSASRLFNNLKRCLCNDYQELRHRMGAAWPIGRHYSHGFTRKKYMVAKMSRIRLPEVVHRFSQELYRSQRPYAFFGKQAILGILPRNDVIVGLY